MTGRVALLLVGIVSSQALSCLDEAGKPVDNWHALKAPASGAYDYFDAKSKSFSASKYSLESNDGAIGNTLMQVYDKAESIAYIMYNDEDPSEKTHDSRAHSKGVLAFDNKQGFWLIHSVPRFPPPVSQKWNGGMVSYTYGQSFVCVTFNLDQLGIVAKQVLVEGPFVYDSNAPSELASKVANFQALVDDNVNDKTETSVITVKSADGVSFTSFAKGKEWGKHLYDDLVAPTLAASVVTETWQNGAKNIKMPSICKPKNMFDVLNVLTVTSAAGTSWKCSQDHSKWAVTSADSGKKIVCFGGINRQSSQSLRGGGTLCQNDPGLYSSMSDRVTSVESCSGAATAFKMVASKKGGAAEEQPVQAVSLQPADELRLRAKMSLDEFRQNVAVIRTDIAAAAGVEVERVAVQFVGAVPNPASVFIQLSADVPDEAIIAVTIAPPTGNETKTADQAVAALMAKADAASLKIDGVTVDELTKVTSVDDSHSGALRHACTATIGLAMLGAALAGIIV